MPFEGGDREAVTIPWGDVYTAYVSTGVPNIEVYMACPPRRIAQMRRLRLLGPVLSLGPVRAFLKHRIEQSISGPSEQKRAESKSELWGEVRSADGRRISATMTAPNGYTLTVTTGLEIAQYVLQNDVEGGYYTPSLLMGAEFAETLPGVSLDLHDSDQARSGVRSE